MTLPDLFVHLKVMRETARVSCNIKAAMLKLNNMSLPNSELEKIMAKNSALDRVIKDHSALDTVIEFLEEELS